MKEKEEKRKPSGDERGHKVNWREVYASIDDIKRFLAERVMLRHNEHFETPSLEKELIMQYFRRPEGREPGEFMPVSLALQVVGANITQKLSTVTLGRAFVDLGFENRCIRHVRGYVVVRRSAEEMRSLRFQLAQEGTDGTDGTAVF